MQDIAYAGYSTIQTSPINECFVGADGGMQISGDGKWYYHYQPTDWTIGNYQLGTKDEFKAMCDEAHKYGIKVIVDVVPNHTTTQVDQVNKNLLDAVGGKEIFITQMALRKLQSGATALSVQQVRWWTS